MRNALIGLIVAAVVAGCVSEASAQCFRGFGGLFGRRAVVRRSDCGAYGAYGAYGGSYGSCGAYSPARPDCSAGYCSAGYCDASRAPGCSPNATAPGCSGGVCEIGGGRVAETVAKTVGTVAGAVVGTVGTVLTGDEARIVAAVNSVRARHGIAPLAPSLVRSDAARRTAGRNAATGNCGHPFPVDCGEICAAGSDAEGTALMWEASGGHAAIMLDPRARFISVGVSVGTLGGAYPAKHWAARIW